MRRRCSRLIISCIASLALADAGAGIAASSSAAADVPKTQGHIQSGPAFAEQSRTEPPAKPYDAKQVYRDRKQLFERIGLATGIPWYRLAAIDQYDRTISAARKRPPAKGLVGIYYSEFEWAGMLNPDHEDRNPATIAVWGGAGRDGNGDGRADRNDDIDVLSVMVGQLLKYGPSEEHFKRALWDRYGNPRSVERIMEFAQIYAAFDTLDLHDHVFPLPLNSNYSYRSTWGASRGWGGYRIHEGTDLYAGYGVPVRSTCYGVIEVMGWNPYGGWRIGVRDLNNVYHYYAHLSGFNKKKRIGDIVKPGDVLGWVGSSGYGKPGTQGKFPPHLHYGLYRDNGVREWPFDPYPYLKRWEREESRRMKKDS